VTAKIRLGCSRDKINAIDIAQVVEGAGASALTVHGRTAADMFRGSADWDHISAIKPHLKRIPLIGNAHPPSFTLSCLPISRVRAESRSVFTSVPAGGLDFFFRDCADLLR
jgi:hypothetical protein